jgi:hypothetical protein
MDFAMDSLAEGMVPTAPARIADALPVTDAAWAEVAPTNVIMPRPKAPAATPASERLPMRIALDNAFPFVNACPLFGPPGAEGSISVVPGRNERQAR